MPNPCEIYVGSPAEGPRPCWHLLRRIWGELAGVWLQSFDGENVGLQVMAREAVKFEEIPIGQEQLLDAVYMNTDVLIKGRWREVEGHIGVVVSKGQVLHVHQGGSALVDPMKSLRVTRILKGPWHAR